MHTVETRYFETEADARTFERGIAENSRQPWGDVYILIGAHVVEGMRFANRPGAPVWGVKYEEFT